MRTVLFLGVLTAFALATNLASPISVWIDSTDTLERLGIEIEVEEIDGFSEGEDSVSVKVTWKPVPEDDNLPPRLDVILFASAKQGEPRQRRMWNRTSPDDNGNCISEFYVARAEVRNVHMVFHNGQHLVHGMTLSDYLDNFPKGFGDSKTDPSK